MLARQLLARLEKQESMIRASAQEALAKTMQYQVERSVIEAGSEPFVISALSIPPHLLEIGGAKLSVNTAFLSSYFHIFLIKFVCFILIVDKSYAPLPVEACACKKLN